MVEHLKNILGVPDLRQRIPFTGLLLILYRIGAHIPAPGVDRSVLRVLSERGTSYGFVFFVSGGGPDDLNIFGAGIMPYINASIILQLLALVVPRLRKLQEQGEQGRKKINLYIFCATAVLAAVEAFGMAIGLEGSPVVPSPGWGFRILTTLTLTAGTIFLMWLAAQINERGIGNGIALFIFADIVVRIPDGVWALVHVVRVGERSILIFPFLAVMMVAITTGVVFMSMGQRRIPVQYAKMVVGQRVYGGTSTHIPLRVITAGVIPVIFAWSVLGLPVIFARSLRHPWAESVRNALAFGGVVYTLLYAGLIISFTFFYTATVFKAAAVAESLKKSGGFVPEVEPGPKTAEFVQKLMNRITFVGALLLVVISLLPELLIIYLGVPFYFGGTSLLIVVGVALDTVEQVECYLIIRRIRGFLR